MVGPDTSRQSRGQLLLITAALIAVFILSAVVLLNLLHEPAGLEAEQDARTVGSVEQVAEQLDDEFNRYMMALSQNQSVPLADNSDLDEEFNDRDFGDKYTNVTTHDSSAFVDISYDDEESKSGEGVWVTDEADSETQLIEEAEELVSLYVRTGEQAVLNISGEDLEIDDDGEVSYGEHGPSCDLESGGDTRVALKYGAGSAQTDAGYCRFDISDELDGSFNVSFEEGKIEPASDSAGVNDALVVTTTGADEVMEPDGFDKNEDAIVDPKFHIEYNDPFVSFEQTAYLYGGGEE